MGELSGRYEPILPLLEEIDGAADPEEDGHLHRFVDERHILSEILDRHSDLRSQHSNVVESPEVEGRRRPLHVVEPGLHVVDAEARRELVGQRSRVGEPIDPFTGVEGLTRPFRQIRSSDDIPAHGEGSNIDPQHPRDPLDRKDVRGLVEEDIGRPRRVIQRDGLPREPRDSGRVPIDGGGIVGNRDIGLAHSRRSRAHADLQRLPAEGADLLEDLGPFRRKRKQH